MNRFRGIKKIACVVLCSCFCLFFQSCRPMVDLQRPEDYFIIKEVSFPDDFESFWNGMNNNYLFWDTDPTDWNAVYREYQPKFAALGVFDNLSSEAYNQAQHKAYQYYEEMTANLIDGHYSLSFFDSSTFDYISPAFARVAQRITHGINEFQLMDSTWSSDDQNNLLSYDFMSNVIFNYLDQESAIKEFHPDPDPNSGLKLGTGKISASDSGTILYFYFSGFSLVSTETQSIIIQQVMNTLKTEDLKGVIIDVRWNGGGDLRDLGFLWGRMTDKDLTPLYTRSKSGEGRLDYTPWVPAKIMASPLAERMKSLGVPVVLLANKLSVSCAELSAMTVKLMENGTFIGERTFGATSPLIDNRIYNGGTFESDIFYQMVYTPFAMAKCWDGAIYEGIGVPPDIEVSLDWGRFLAKDPAKRGDSQLEAAIRHIDPNHTFKTTATALSVCHNEHISSHKVTKGFAQRGKPTKGRL